VRAELDRALQTRRTILSAPTQLIEGGVGLVARQALYERENFWGLVSITLNVTPFFAEAGMLDPNANLSLALRDAELDSPADGVRLRPGSNSPMASRRQGRWAPPSIR
jgi:sensor domain CHASE-containing protein